MVYKPQDSYFKKAKQEGYRSRAAYKLIELHQRFRLMKAGDLIVDLGAAPGGWLQIAAKSIAPNGKVVGVDLQTIEPFSERAITLVRGDITAPEIQEKIKTLLGGPVDCVISDLAPKLSGIRDADTARCLELNRTALQIATQLLRRGGKLLIKSFVNQELQVFTLELKKHFTAVQRTRPEASREGSSEFYFYAADFRDTPNR
jgi:23S rRNA (uridine2552-2'-O)-methyltransferase